MITDIKFDCTHCGQRMVVESTAAGMVTECPYCNASIVIPRRGSMHERDYDAPPAHSRSGEMRGEFADPETDSLRQELTDASVQLTRIEGELAESREAIEKLKKERAKLRGDVTRLKNEMAAKDAAAAEVLAAREEAESRAAALASELNKTEGEVMMQQEEAIRLRRQVDAFEAEHANLLPRLKTAERDARANAQSLRKREIELGELRAALTDTQAERTAALRDTQVLEQRAAALDSELAGARNATAQAEAKLRATDDELAETRKTLAESHATVKSLTSAKQELEKECDALRRSLSEDTTGRDLVEAREHLRVTGTERDRLVVRVQQLEGELDTARTRQRGIEEQLTSLQRDLEETRRRADAESETRLRQDNEVLRGIIARQNGELEQRHALIVRLKRAQLGVKLAYAAFGIALVIIAMWALRVVPGLKLGNFF